MSRRRALLAILVLAAAAWGSLSQAQDRGTRTGPNDVTKPPLGQTQQDAAIFFRIDDKGVENILTNMKITFQKIDFKGVTFFTFNLDGSTAILGNFNNSLAISTPGFKTVANVSVPMDRINEWNRTRRFAKAFLDKNGFAILQMDIDFFGGANQRIITEWINLFRNNLREFANYTK